MLTRFFSPPLIPLKCQFPIFRSAQSESPICIIVPSTTSLISSLLRQLGNRSLAEYQIVSLTVSVPNSVFSCVT